MVTLSVPALSTHNKDRRFIVVLYTLPTVVSTARVGAAGTCWGVVNLVGSTTTAPCAPRVRITRRQPFCTKASAATPADRIKSSGFLAEIDSPVSASACAMKLPQRRNECCGLVRYYGMLCGEETHLRFIDAENVAEFVDIGIGIRHCRGCVHD